MKLPMSDGSGLVLVSKRPGEGEFRWPRVEDGVIRLSPGQLTALLEGLDWTPCTRVGCARRLPCSSRRDLMTQ
ncbi:MAG: IS66 family insertion sequence element accessory protein TnpB [Methylibium sp.]